MSFQIHFTDTRHGLERRRVSVANSEEEFRNTTVQELKRRLIPEDQHTILRYRFNTLEDEHTLGFYGIKHEDHIIAVRRRISVREKRPRDSSPVHESTVKNSKLDNSDLETLEDDHTLGFGIKHEDEVTAAETASSGRMPSAMSDESFKWPMVIPLGAHTGFSWLVRRIRSKPSPPPPEDEDEDKVIPRSQSMDNLLFDMNQPQ